MYSRKRVAALLLLTAALWFGMVQEASAAPPSLGKDVCADLNRILCQELLTHPEPLLLPDLRTLPPFDLRLRVNARGEKLLSFSNSIANSGAGALELRGEITPSQESMRVTQRMVRGEQEQFRHLVGEFEYHPSHGHWHWQGFSVYEIWSVNRYGGLDENLLTSGKVGYCLLDLQPLMPGQLEGMASAGESPRWAYYQGCNWPRQGISAGWLDTYRFHLPGQTLDISNLPDAIYALRSTVDPNGLLLEEDEMNNSAVLFFSIQGKKLSVYGGRVPGSLMFHPFHTGQPGWAYWRSPYRR